ncbi:ribosome recycling factor [Candidatus Kaiserbacteria bacterium CG_4_8_14_3_um_filter_38_9]|uniref:Ribosome recycling factor n=1 Tax=Candidatus Kaiserbacteria bacterium CG_4_8_14_3_um_filter_38_9 TaxID=1974599 RepID=A0A2M7IPP3_9BACT|nr:MAG: ribosome recycling factor [Candidatus Kaiserbacteria bacterium CG_4_8_14_3_um_filter_38_9]
MDEVFKQKLKEATDWLQKEFTGIRTGQATPALLDCIKVESYGTFMPIVQIGSVGIEDARTIRIAPWDLSQVPAIERAIREADLGVSVSSDSMGLRVIFPELTSERRVQLIKLAKSKLEDARVTVRAMRDEIIKEIEAKRKTNEISEDDKFFLKDKVQKAVDNSNRNLELLFTQKEAEISL